MRRKRSLNTWLARVTLYAVLLLGAVGMVFPFAWMLITSFQSRQESLSNSLRDPRDKRALTLQGTQEGQHILHL